MTPAGFLRFVAGIRGFGGAERARRIDEVVRKVHLESVLHQPIETLSKGFKRRVALAQAILHDPEVLVLDEPTDGLDPNQKYEVRTLIGAMARDKAIVLSTHILEEVEAVCTRVIIINRGRIVFDGTPSALDERAPASVQVNRLGLGLPLDHDHRRAGRGHGGGRLDEAHARHHEARARGLLRDARGLRLHRHLPGPRGPLHLQRRLGDIYNRGLADLRPFFAFHPWLYLFLIPAISMRLWAEERRLGTIELLMTLPVTIWEAVLGKFLAAWLFAGIALALTFPIWITVNYSATPTTRRSSPATSGASSWRRLPRHRLRVSAVTKNQVIAFVISVVLCFLFLLSASRP
jgi:energy-coupling factor transporter ATP-binding protein EcfA2